MLEKLIETCVHRRVATIFAVAVVAAVGVRAYLNTPIEAFPDVTNAQVTVIAQMPGYAPEENAPSIWSVRTSRRTPTWPARWKPGAVAWMRYGMTTFTIRHW